mmetsp:Transcript_11037/g.34093  ORF Transcript_11037/g.34093 Transcript_11037/m.34093 type:complete len:236 (+) Transcript_11037:379-1086(+)
MIRALSVVSIVSVSALVPASVASVPLTTRAAATMATDLASPVCRERDYGDRIAQYLVDLHDSEAVFDFCGGMMFQLVLTDALVARLKAASSPVVVHDAATRRMSQVPGYAQEGRADDEVYFHGREVRKVPSAAGGHGFVLQLSAAGEDPEGWSPGEREGYDGWGHDSSRVWRDGTRLEDEGVAGFQARFGPEAFTLNHRFYFHLDATNQLWLSAEDGCEGRLVDPAEKKKMFGLF